MSFSNRGGSNPIEHLMERQGLLPVGVVDAGGFVVHRSDGRLELVGTLGACHPS